MIKTPREVFEKWYYGIRKFEPRVLLAKSAFDRGRKYQRELSTEPKNISIEEYCDTLDRDKLNQDELIIEASGPNGMTILCGKAGHAYSGQKLQGKQT